VSLQNPIVQGDLVSN